MSRRLLTTRRHVPLDRADEYVVAWAAVERMVTAGGSRAWLFRGAAHEDQFIEFIEWSDGARAPHDDADIAGTRAHLDTFAAPGLTEEWEDVR
jgi:hypothetical protein